MFLLFLKIFIVLYCLSMIMACGFLLINGLIGMAIRKGFHIHKWKKHTTHKTDEECLIQYRVCDKCSKTEEHMC